MDVTYLFVGAILAAAVWHVAATILIYDNMRLRGLQPSFLLLRLYGPKYASDYRMLTRAETGSTGPLFYHWVTSINVALLAFVVMLVAEWA